MIFVEFQKSITFIYLICKNKTIKNTKYPKTNNAPIIGFIREILLESKSLIANDAKTNALGIRQNNRPFHIPRKLLLIVLNF